jgi:hypothetical protein
MFSLMGIFVVGIAVALLRRRLLATEEDRARRGDAPARLLGWAVGLLAAQRHTWGQAMIGELDRLDGQARRWRFALGCVGAAMVLPPWGRAVTTLAALLAMAAGAGGLAVYIHMHYRLGTDGWTWVLATVLVLILVGYLLAASVLLRRPKVTGPGLIGGLLVAAAWVAASGFTFNNWVNSTGRVMWLLLLAPIVVGVGATLWGGNAAVGRRAVRLASATAALGVYLYGVLAVAVTGATGHDPSDGWTTAQIVDDNLGNQAVFFLMALPLMTATIGWAAAAATARLRYAQPATAPATPLLDPPGVDSALTAKPRTTKPESQPMREDHQASTRTPLDDAKASRQRRMWYVLLGAALAASAFLIFVAFLGPHSR